ncbi:ABC transporter ATP-binding protein/permease [Acetobacter sp. AN02]|uniref:ABCB family ABC transporter ATP-binding protein/permease n=1 Tax=Acetobacter sp. AN02 TaxID=2894186 RepID=UPI0024346216|nr:ABC transporter ATP-binding protein/permease [Acetobacter sp. AN02]MDG6094458.1 ABC transporter ATP-binding protein/permease [Acetobacter sp. AN02]
MSPPDSANSAALSKPVSLTISRLLPYLWPDNAPWMRARLVLALLMIVVGKLVAIFVPFLYSRIVDRLGHAGYAAGVATVPVALILGYGLVRISAAAFNEWRDSVFAPVRYRVARVAAMRSFRHMHGLSLRFHLDRRTGGVTRAIERGTEAIETLLRMALVIFPTLLEALIVTIVIWWLFDLRYAAIILVAVGIYIVFTLKFTSWRIGIRRRMNESNSEATGKALDSLLNYETVKYFGNEEHEAGRYDEAQARYERAAVRTQYSLSALNFGQAAIIALAVTVIMLLAGHDVSVGKLTIGKFVLINTYLMQLYMPLNFLGSVYSSIRTALVDLEHMFGLLEENQEIRDPESPVPMKATLAEAKAAEIRFEDVHFGYTKAREILRGVSFDVPAGGMLAIVGPTGAGKSTISRLLFRYYDVWSGRVLVDGTDVRDLQQSDLRAAIGVVPQDTVLFNETIGYNIAYGRLGSTQEKVENAARLAQIHDFIMSLPDGYQTRVGERGLKLSGGEKQRVAIARTILKDPRILLLDEATSALDTHTEREIQQALRAVSAERTTLVIAHRLSTVVDADQILVLAGGQVQERGNHAELIALGGLYANMWASQDAGTEQEAAAV